MMNFGSRKSEGKGHQRSRVTPASVIAVASGKGGVGKTWLSTTLAACFAKMGRRTLLVDGDLGLANVDVQLGIAPETDLAAVIAGWVELEDAVCKVNGGAGSEIGFDVLPAARVRAPSPACRLKKLPALPPRSPRCRCNTTPCWSTLAPASKTTSCALPARATVA
jgi:Mrp family chromosome partitioning ATPase